MIMRFKKIKSVAPRVATPARLADGGIMRLEFRSVKSINVEFLN